MPDRLKLSSSTDGGTATVVVDGEIDLTSAETLATAAREHLDAGDDVVLDCDGLAFIDSTGLSTLVDLHHAAVDGGKSLRLVNVPDHARRLMEITKIDELLQLG